MLISVFLDCLEEHEKVMPQEPLQVLQVSYDRSWGPQMKRKENSRWWNATKNYRRNERIRQIQRENEPKIHGNISEECQHGYMGNVQTWKSWSNQFKIGTENLLKIIHSMMPEMCKKTL